MKQALNVSGLPVRRNEARKLMQGAEVKVRQWKKFRVTTNSSHLQPVHENLLGRQFNVPNTDPIYPVEVASIRPSEA